MGSAMDEMKLLIVGIYVTFYVDFIKKYNFNTFFVAPPRFFTVEPKEKIIEGEMAVIMCDVYAVPKPTLDWFLNGHPLNQMDSKYSIDNNVLRYA